MCASYLALVSLPGCCFISLAPWTGRCCVVTAVWLWDPVVLASSLYAFCDFHLLVMCLFIVVVVLLTFGFVRVLFLGLYEGIVA